jgi:predicted house-cleaning noncanonical NTP pyrophosphatase (MazG superfamily)
VLWSTTALIHYFEGRARCGQLVRDKIPDIIRASGRTPHVTALGVGAYRAALHDKLREEVDELIAAHTTDAVIEEAADIVEVLVAIVGELGVRLDCILNAAQHKRMARGGFSMRLLLNRVDSNRAAR